MVKDINLESTNKHHGKQLSLESNNTQLLYTSMIGKHIVDVEVAARYNHVVAEASIKANSFALRQ